MWCYVMWCHFMLSSTTQHYEVLRSTTPYYKVLRQYYSSITKYYARTTPVLQSTTPVLLHFGSSALICKIQTSENFLSLFVTFLSQPCLVSSLPWFPTSWVAWVRCSSHRLRWRHSMVSVDAGLETQPEVELVEKAEDKKQGWTPKSSEPDSEMTEAEIMDNDVKDQEEEDWAHGRSSKIEFLWGGLPSVMEPRHWPTKETRSAPSMMVPGVEPTQIFRPIVKCQCQICDLSPGLMAAIDEGDKGAGAMQRSAPSMMVPGVEPTQDNSPDGLALHARRAPATFVGGSSRITIGTGHPRTMSGCCWRPTWPRPIWGSKYCRQSGSTR